MEKTALTQLIEKRRATPPRLFAKKDVERKLVDQVLANANWAPNHKKTEPWRFKIYTGEAKQKLATQAKEILQKKLGEGAEIAPDKIEKFASTLERVPVVIAVVLQRDAAKRLPEWEEVAAVSMAVQNMWLTATALELAAFWATPAFVSFFNDILELQEHQKSLGFFYLGHVMMDYPSPGRGNLSAKVEWK